MDEPVRILCVDDERNVLRALERLFIDDDYEILTALSGEDGLSVMEAAEGIQIVLCDYRMPGMNGVEFLSEVCRRWPFTVRIVLSGYADTAAVVASVNEGQIYKFIPKPWNDDELRIAIQNAREKYFLKQQNARLVEELRVANESLSRAVDHLEATVAERTARLVHQNQALKVAQNILHALPFVVYGFDLKGVLVQSNQAGLDLLRDTVPFPLGRRRRDILPPEVNDLIDTLPALSCIHATVKLQGRDYHAWLTHLREPDQEGIILALQQAG